MNKLPQVKSLAGFLKAAVTLSCLVLAACGGGSGPATQTQTSNNSATTSLSGTVIDGYIEGATVCLDLNANLACDTGEPSATTIKDGTYKLDTSNLSSAQISAAHLLTVVPTTAKDADDGGKTLAEAGKSGFNLLAPAAAYASTDGGTISGAVISPLTTMVAHEMMTSKTPLATAETKVRASLSLPDGTNLRQDFVAKKEATLTEKAQMLAIALGKVKSEALADQTAKPTDKEAFLAALHYLQTQVADLQKAFDDAKKANTAAKPTDLVKTALEKVAAKPDVTALLTESKKTASSVPSSVKSVIDNGFYSVTELTSCKDSPNECGAEYQLIKGISGTNNLRYTRYFSGNPEWIPETDQDREFNDYILTPKGWIVDDFCEEGKYDTYKIVGENSIDGTNCNGTSFQVTGRTVNASGKSLAELVGWDAESSMAQTIMPTGSELYWFGSSNQEQRYMLWTGNAIKKFIAPNTEINFKSFEEFIGRYQTISVNQNAFFGWSGLIFSFDAGGDSTGGTITLYSDPEFNYTITGQAKYSLRQVHGQTLLVIEGVQPPDNDKGDLIMFGFKDGVLYGGHHSTSLAQRESAVAFNKTMVNAILNAAGLKPVVE